jgi:hypothetical protein
MLWGMRQASFLTPLTRPIGWSGAAAVIAGAAMGAPVGARVTCYLTSWLPGTGGCAPGGFPAGALVGALLALVALPLLGQGTRRGEHAAHRPGPTTTTAARLVWLAIAAALGRWLAEAVVNQELGQEGMGADGSGVAGDPARCAGRRRRAGDGGPGAAAPAWLGPVGGRGRPRAAWDHRAGRAGGLGQGVGGLAGARVGRWSPPRCSRSTWSRWCCSWPPASGSSCCS